MSKASDFLNTTNWEYKEVANGQYCIKTCPLCSDERWKFYMAIETGLWDCKICSESGNLYQLKGKLGGLEEISDTSKLFANHKPLDEKLLEEYIENLNNDKQAYEYLTKTRGFTEEIIKKYKLGLDGDWLVIPHFQDGKLWNLKMRNYKEKDFRRVSGQPSILFNVDNINYEKKALVIVESETDCIAASQMGIENVVGLTTGAGTFMPEWIPFTLKFKEIYVCLNSDLPGQKGAYNLSEKLGMGKCRNLILPTKDVNDFLLKYPERSFYDLLKHSKKFNIKNIKNVSDYIKDLDEWFEKDGTLAGLKLPFPILDKYLNGFKAEDLIILSGDAGIGKTTLSLNILHHFLKNNKRCLGFFLEGKIMYFISRMMSIDIKKKVEDLRKDESEWEQVKSRFSDYPLYFYSGTQNDLDSNKIVDLLLTAVKLYDIDFVFIDNLQKFIKDDREVVQQTSRTISALKDLAVDLKIPILLITHIRKPKDDGRISMHDAKSSSTIYQDSDVYLILFDKNKSENKEENICISIEKNRMGEGGIDIQMIFDKSLASFRERIIGVDGRTKKKEKESDVIEGKAEEVI